MLVIRQQQMDDLSQSALATFENEMVIHCNDLSPRLCKSAGEEQLRTAIRQALAQSSGYGFTHRGPVRLFIEMMLLFGCSFDTDPQYEWTKEILTTDDPQMRRAERLYAEMLDYLEKVNGSEDAFRLEALERISAIVQLPPSSSKEDFIPNLLREITSTYPQKADYVGDAAFKLLFREGTDKADAHDMTTQRGWTLVCVLMFVFGHGCADDPLHQWIGQILKDENLTNRYKQLENKTLEWLDRLIAWHKEGAQT